jgi:hypothetical protein
VNGNVRLQQFNVKEILKVAGFEIASEVTTEGTDLDGSRHTAWSEWTSTTAPTDFVINNSAGQVKTEWISDNGSENDVEIVFADYVEVLPGTGVLLPQTIKVRTYARSPRGFGGAGRGWSKVKVTGSYVKYR